MTFQIVKIGQCDLICADCREFLPTIPNESIDTILTDPPYGIGYLSNMRAVSEKFDAIYNDGENDAASLKLFAYRKFFRILKDNSVAICFASFKNYSEDYDLLSEIFEVRNAIVWDKGGGGIGDLAHSLLTDYELAIIAHKGAARLRGKRDGSVWRHSKVNPSDMIHPTEKPANLIRRLILMFSDPGQTILDPFMGSGTTGVACVKTGRKFIGIEIEKKYFDIACQRIEKAYVEKEMEFPVEVKKEKIKSALW